MRWTIVALLALSGCDDFTAPTHPVDQVYEPTWAGMTTLFADHCNECHGTEGIYPRLPSGVLDDIVLEERQLVVAGDPGASRLWRVVSGHTTDADYARMPLGRPLLPTPMADTMADWIAAGADLGDDDPCSPIDAVLWYPDEDGDTYGRDTDAISACDDPSTDALAYSTRNGDCNDTDTAFFPGAEETSCTDTNDYNCDGSVGAEDSDQDGFFACEECDDRNADVNPGATEICNGIDDDCDRATDDADDDLDASTGSPFFEDGDGDGYGTDADIVSACSVPAGFAENDGDCNDSDPFVNPGVSLDGPVADGVDNDCDTVVDEDAASITWTEHVEPILSANCVQCHANWGDRDFLLANTADGFPLIEPNNASDSYIYMKVINDPRIQGARMPRGRAPLSDADLNLIETWIDGGAPL